MSSILHGASSQVHLLAALVALVAGTAVLLASKGTTWHRLVGRLYAASMVVVLATAFRIYSLFGHFGIVHWGAVGGSVALLLGVGAAIGKAVVPHWQRWHYLGMGVSVTGLYAALVVESSYRLFAPAYFWWSTLGPAAAVLLAGGLLLYRGYPAQLAATKQA